MIMFISGIAHLLRGNLAQVLPLVAALVGAELDLSVSIAP